MVCDKKPPPARQHQDGIHISGSHGKGITA
uniref:FOLYLPOLYGLUTAMATE SYNTHASE PROTEIN FOLC n=1 Tax=Siphoviridae sp. ct5FX1 TaxID=2825335 RepID=A0A8S5UPN4_9CAUD|nr:MAG TPA: FOLYLPOLYGLUTAMATE SYNTHASE PROTEIN FOLC [Siphoviridae sp. ct5FX1]